MPTRTGVAAAPAVYTDDTGWRIHGETAHLMTFDTDQATVFQIRGRHRNEEVRELIPADYAHGDQRSRGHRCDLLFHFSAARPLPRRINAISGCRSLGENAKGNPQKDRNDLHRGPVYTAPKLLDGDVGVVQREKGVTRRGFDMGLTLPRRPWADLWQSVQATMCRIA